MSQSTTGGNRGFIDFVVNKSPQAGAPLASSQMTEIARATENAWSISGKNQFTMSFFDVSKSPRVQATSIPTTATFDIIDGTGTRNNFEMPWCVGDGAVSVRAIVTLAIYGSQQATMQIRMNSGTLVDSVASTTGQWFPVTTVNSVAPNYGPWAPHTTASTVFGNSRLVQSVVRLNNLTLPANRRVALTFDLKVNNASGADWAISSLQRTVRIVRIYVKDVIYNPAPQDDT